MRRPSEQILRRFDTALKLAQLLGREIQTRHELDVVGNLHLDEIAQLLPGDGEILQRSGLRPVGLSAVDVT